MEPHPGMKASQGRMQALATHFPAHLRMPLDVALALYGGMESKSPGLTLTTRKRTPVYSGEVADILGGQSAFVPSGFSLSAASLQAVADFVREAGISRVLEFGAGVTTIVLPKLLGDSLRMYVSVEEDADYAATLRPVLAADPAYRRVSIARLDFSEEPGTPITRDGVGSFHATSFKGLRETVQAAFAENGPELVLIDGPSRRARWGRFNALADIVDLLPRGTLILLDDALRHREVGILDEWRRRGLAEIDGIVCLGTGIGLARVL